MKNKIIGVKKCSYCLEETIYEHQIMCNDCAKNNSLSFKIQSMPLIVRILALLIIGIFLLYIAFITKPIIDQLISEFYEENFVTILLILFLLPWIAAFVYLFRVFFK